MREWTTPFRAPRFTPCHLLTFSKRMNSNAPISERVVETLKENNHLDLANRLDSYIDQLKSEELAEREKAKNEIQGMCNIRALGDLNIETISYNEWGKMLEKLTRFTHRKTKTKAH